MSRKLVSRRLWLCFAAIMLTVLFSFFGMNVYAEEAATEEVTVVASGDCSASAEDNVTWMLTSDGVLTISGTGKMRDYTHSGKTPWREIEFTDIIIQDGVTRIGSYAFYNINVINVTIAGSVESIGSYAFSGCMKMQNLDIKYGVQTINSKAFAYCSQLKKVELPESITNIFGEIFYQCSGLTQLTIPGCVSLFGGLFGIDSYTNSIGISQPLDANGYTRTFYFPRNLSEITILGSIQERAFYNCTFLKKVTIIGDESSIGNNAFYGCSGLKTVEMSGVKSIGELAFYNCETLSDIDFGNDLVEIKNNAFYGCDGLTKLDLPNSLESIGESSFYNCEGLKEVNLPESLTTIGKDAFYKCVSLLDIIIPGSVTNVGYSAFYGCTGLTSVVISEGATCLSGAMFQDCVNLESVTMTNSVTTLGNGFTFSGCKSLKRVVISKSVKNIAGYTFSSCSNFTIMFKGTTEEWNKINKDAEWDKNIGFAPVSYTLICLGDSVSEISTASLNLGTDLTVNFYATLSAERTSAQMRFTMNGKTVTVDGVSADNDMYKYAFKGINPQCMGDTILAELIFEDQVIDSLEYSIRSYCDKVFAMEYTELGMTETKYNALCVLLADLLEYGAESQIYNGYKTDALVNEGISGKSEFSHVLQSDSKLVTAKTVEGVAFKSVTLRFDKSNQIYFLFSAPDVSKAQILVVADSGNAVLYSGSDFTEYSGTTYMIGTEDINATNYDDVYTAVLLYDGEVVQSFNYSVASYIYSKQNQMSEGVLSNIARLSRALYNYGKAAEAYAAVN